jgi:hypothetical protein
MGKPVEPQAPMAPRASLDDEPVGMPLRVPPALPEPPAGERPPSSGLTMGQRLRARSEQAADLPVAQPVSVIQRQMARRALARGQAAARAAERQGLPPAVPRGTIQRAKRDPYGGWLKQVMDEQGLPMPAPKKFSMQDLFRPDPHKLPKGFMPFDPNQALPNVGEQVTAPPESGLPLTPPTTTSSTVPTPLRRPPPPLRPRPTSTTSPQTTAGPSIAPRQEPSEPPLDMPLAPPAPRRERKPIKLKTKTMKFLEDEEKPKTRERSNAITERPGPKTRKRSDSSPPPRPDPELQAQWRAEAEEREREEQRKKEEQLKQEMELEDLRKRLEGGSRGSDVDIPDLARRVYPLIRRMMRQDRERR